MGPAKSLQEVFARALAFPQQCGAPHAVPGTRRDPEHPRWCPLAVGMRGLQVEGMLGRTPAVAPALLKVGCTRSSYRSLLPMPAFARPEEEGHGHACCLRFPDTVVAVAGAASGGTSLCLSECPWWILMVSHAG